MSPGGPCRVSALALLLALPTVELGAAEIDYDTAEPAALLARLTEWQREVEATSDALDLGTFKKWNAELAKELARYPELASKEPGPGSAYSSAADQHVALGSYRGGRYRELVAELTDLRGPVAQPTDELRRHMRYLARVMADFRRDAEEVRTGQRTMLRAVATRWHYDQLASQSPAAARAQYRALAERARELDISLSRKLTAVWPVTRFGAGTEPGAAGGLAAELASTSGDLDDLDRGPARAGDCPSFVMNQVLADMRDGLGVGAPWDADPSIGRLCQPLPDRPFGFKNDQDARLERFLRRHPQIVGYRPAHSAIGAACRARLEQDGRLAAIPEGQRGAHMAAVTAEYYLAKKRLTDAVAASLESLATLDKISKMRCSAPETRGRSQGGRLLSDLACGEYGSAMGAAEACDRYQSQCAAAVEYRGLIETTELAMTQADAARAELVRGSHTAEKRRTLEELVRVAEATSPWLGSGAFKQGYEEQVDRCRREHGITRSACETWRASFVCEAIKADAAANRAAIREDLDRFNRAAQCLEGVGTDCDARAFRAALARAPTFAGVPEPDLEAEGPLEGEREQAALDAIYAGHQLSMAECRRKLRDNADAIGDAKKDFAFNVALTVATAGLGSVAGGARLAGGAAKVAGTAGRTSKMSQLGLRARAFAGQAARVLELAELGMDVADLGSSVADAVRECSDAFARTGVVRAPRRGAAACPGATGLEGPRVAGDYRDCVLRKLALQAAFTVLPAASAAALKKILDRRTLSRALAALPANRALSADKAAAVLKVFGGRFDRMSDEALESGMAELRRAGFSDDDARRLLASMATDVKDLDGRLVHGLDGDVLAHAKVGRHTFSAARDAGALVFQACSSCTKLELAFGAQLKRHPDLAKRLERLRRSFDELGDADVPQHLKNDLAALTRDLDSQKGADFLEGHGVRSAKLLGLENALRPFLDGDLTEKQMNALAAKSDEVLWELDRYCRRSERNKDLCGLKDFEPMTVPAVRRRAVDAHRFVDSLLAGVDRETRERIKAAIASRTGGSLVTRDLFFGGNPASLFHDKLTFPRTTPEMRANARAKGSYPHPLDNRDQKISLGDEIEADHVYPVSLIVRDRVFRSLSDDLKREVIHNEANIMPLPAHLNQSKGDRLAKEWDEALRDARQRRLDPGYLNRLAAKQDELKAKLTEQIRCLAAGRPPPTCRFAATAF
jgi:hypothetical protein